jgi:hypothetical protein
MIMRMSSSVDNLDNTSLLRCTYTTGPLGLLLPTFDLDTIAELVTCPRDFTITAVWLQSRDLELGTCPITTTEASWLLDSSRFYSRRNKIQPDQSETHLTVSRLAS